MPKNKKPVTWQNVEEWMGTDATYEDYQQIIADIANGDYKPNTLLSDIEGTCNL